MTETMTTSSTGGQKGMKPQRYDLLPKAGLDAIAEVFAFGATKYASHNWRRGYEWSKSYAAAMRHLTAHWDGETYDAESGLSHLAHAGCHILFMLTWLSEQGEGGEFDDRYVSEAAAEEERRRLAEQRKDDFVAMTERLREAVLDGSVEPIEPLDEAGFVETSERLRNDWEEVLRLAEQFDVDHEVRIFSVDIAGIVEECSADYAWPMVVWAETPALPTENARFEAQADLTQFIQEIDRTTRDLAEVVETHPLPTRWDRG